VQRGTWHCFINAWRERRDLRFSLVFGDAALSPTDDLQEMKERWIELLGRQCVDWNPDIRLTSERLECWRQNADDCVTSGSQLNGLTHDGVVSPVAIDPEPMTQDGYVVSADRDVFFRQERAA